MHFQDESGRVYITKGGNFQSLGDYKKACFEHDEKPLKIPLEEVDLPGQRSSLSSLPFAYKSLNASQKAIEYHKKHLKIAIEINDQAGEGEPSENLGNAYQSLGDYGKTIEYHEKQLEIAIEVGDRAGEPMEISALLTNQRVTIKKRLSITINILTLQ